MELDTWQASGRSFHFGRHGLGQEETSSVMTSDSLFAALTSALATSSGPEAVQHWIGQFTAGTPALVLSSAFPRAGSVRFFPMPLKHFPSGGPAALPVKTLKKIKYLSETLFKEMLNGADLAALVQKGRGLQDGQFLISAAEFDTLPVSLRNSDLKVFKIDQRPRVVIGRESSQSTLYHTGQVTFSEDCGLWFAARWLRNEPALQQQFENMLGMLGDAGLGGERSSGFGKAALQKMGSLNLPDPNGAAWVSLSRYLPAEDETPALLSPQAAYAIETVGGWIYSTGVKSERRRSINMLTEGSVIGRLDKSAPGQMVDVQPDYNGMQPVGHPVWRCGFALAAGIYTG